MKRRKDVIEKEKKCIETIKEMIKNKEKISFYCVAKKCNCAKTFLYNQETIRKLIEENRTEDNRVNNLGKEKKPCINVTISEHLIGANFESRFSSETWEYKFKLKKTSAHIGLDKMKIEYNNVTYVSQILFEIKTDMNMSSIRIKGYSLKKIDKLHSNELYYPFGETIKDVDCSFDSFPEMLDYVYNNTK